MSSSEKKLGPGFWSLFNTQFLGALNDNLFKNALVMLITFKGLRVFDMSTELTITLAGGIFILPFFLFSASAGQISDIFEKRKIILLVKYGEVLIMLLAAAGLYLQNTLFLLCVLFLMGLQSSFFGPLKYSIIPNLITKDQLISGNAYIELGTFLAILLGTIGGSLLISYTSTNILVLALLSVAVLGVLSARKIPSTPIYKAPKNISWSPLKETMRILKLSHESKSIFNSILGISWFWFLGAAILSLVPVYGKNVLQGNESVVTAFLACFTIGIGLGSLLCEKLSFKRIEIGLVPLGSLGMSLFLFDLSQITPNSLTISLSSIGIQEFALQSTGFRILLDFLGIALFGGLFIVPLYTLIQERSPEQTRSQIIAANNILNALFMVLSSLLIMLLYQLNFSVRAIFGLLALLNLLVAIKIYYVVPEFALRFVTWILVNIMYRLKVSGLQNIPEKGAAILTCNHISFVDWLIISGAIKRPVRFVMYYKFFKIPLIRFLMKDARVIPIAGRKENPEILQKAMKEIEGCLKDGDLLCIFPEGKISHDGKLSPFRPGVQKIAEKTPSPVIPMALIGLWGSLFSRKGGKALLKVPRRFWHRIELKIAPPLEMKEKSLSTEQLREITLDMLS